MSAQLLETEEVGPPGWEQTVLKMKSHPEIDNPFALAWWMSGQGMSPGGKGKEADVDGAVNAFRKKYPDGAGVLHPPKSESNAGSSMGQLFRGKPKKSESHVRFPRCRFREASVNDEKRIVDVVIIAEGLGNLGDMHYYTASALQSAPPVFEGMKIYADHPSKSEEVDRPERSTRDIIGYHTNVRYEESEGRGCVLSTVKILAGNEYDWAWQQIKESVAYSARYPDKEFIGISINADGESIETPIDEFLSDYQFPPAPEVRKKVDEAKAEGKPTVYVVSKITDVVSADLVTEAGAGGRIDSLRESKRRRARTMKEWLMSLVAKAKGGTVTLSESILKKKIQEAEDEDEKKQSEDGTDDGDGEPDGDEKPDIHIHAGENEQMMLAYGRYVKNKGKMPYKQFEAEYQRMQAEDETKMEAEDEDEQESEDEGEGEGEGKQSEGTTVPTGIKQTNRRLRRVEAENAVLKENLRRMKLDSVIERKMLEAGFSEEVSKTIMPYLKQARSERDVITIIKDFMEAIKASEGRIESGPMKGSSLKESSNDDLFSGCVPSRN